MNKKRLVKIVVALVVILGVGSTAIASNYISSYLKHYSNKELITNHNESKGNNSIDVKADDERQAAIDYIYNSLIGRTFEDYATGTLVIKFTADEILLIASNGISLDVAVRYSYSIDAVQNEYGNWYPFICSDFEDICDGAIAIVEGNIKLEGGSWLLK